jgi:hypothetical protein
MDVNGVALTAYIAVFNRRIVIVAVVYRADNVHQNTGRRGASPRSAIEATPTSEPCK